MKEGRHYSIFEEVILLAFLSVLFLYVLNIVKMKFKFYFLVVIFHWIEYTKKVQLMMNIFLALIVVFEKFTLDISAFVW